METVTVRELSGELITGATARGQTLGVTNRGTLVAVLLPLTRHVLERIARRDAQVIQRDVDRAEAEMAAERDLATVADLADLPDESGDASAVAKFTRVTIRALTGKVLAAAAADGRPMMVTSDGVSVALLVPVTPSWVERLVEGGIRGFLDGDASALTAAEPVAEGPTAAVPRVTSPTGAPVAIARPAPVIPVAGMEIPWSPSGVPISVAGAGLDFLHRVAIGIRITSDAAQNKRLVGVVTDMLANVLAGPRELPLEGTEERDVLAQILNLVEELSPLISHDQRLVGVGLELGGHVDRGRVIYSPNAHWTQFPLAERLAAMLRVPVVLENDANALAIYERRFTGIEDRSFAVIVLNEVGVGCGLMLDGQIYHGVRGMAGEIGHLPVALGDPGEDATCRCVNRGCLESAATQHAIELALRRLKFTGSYAEALQSVRLEPVGKVFSDAGVALGRAMVTVINLINPSAIIFYGLQELLGPPRTFHLEDRQAARAESEFAGISAARVYSESMVDAIRQSAFSTGVYQDCRFIVRTANDVSSAKAAAACLIDRVELAPLELLSRA
jgi:predicted NBD/HSP70 family sugar kinase/antitoxin (DNA-binding transcriptional repressor) of toxin-antitoxin stability system